MKRTPLWLIAALLCGLAHLAEAQQQRIPLIARLSSGRSGDPLQKAGFAAFQKGLSELRWIESQNVTIEARWTGDSPGKARGIIADLVHRGANV